MFKNHKRIKSAFEIISHKLPVTPVYLTFQYLSSDLFPNMIQQNKFCVWTKKNNKDGNNPIIALCV